MTTGQGVRTIEDRKRRIAMIAEAVTGLKYYEWSRIEMAINKKFSSTSAKVVVEDAEELKKAIQIEF